ncbi:MAG: hypothetical protein EA384_11135 [Spirochaetaceae bacterium]|nr:MAG: hypothetical protein EA384_11135 [Spirochaetaceae bacterium]
MPMAGQMIAWYRTPIDRAKLRELTERSDARALAHALGFLLMYLASASLNVYLFLRGLWVPMVVGCYLHAIIVNYMGMGAAVHELSHRTAFKTKWLNEVFLHLFAFLTWNNQLHFKESHTKHHLYTYFREHDREQRSDPIAFGWLDVVSWFTFDIKKFKQFMWANLNHAVGNFNVDFFFWCPLLPPQHVKSRRMMWWARATIVAHAAIVAAAVYFQLWVVIFLVSFAYFFATFLEHGTGIIQHMGLRGDVPDWRMNSYTVDLGPMLRFLYWNMNYHTEHHMYASVPFYNLPKLRKEIEWDLQRPLKGFIPALRHIVGVKRKQAEDPGFRYMPEFPETANPPKVS